MMANFIVDLTASSSLFSVIIIHDQARMNNSWNPAEQSQNDAEEKTRDAARHEHRQWRQHHAEKISQRLHLVALPLRLLLFLRS